MQELLDNKALINDMLARYGVRFGIYKNGNFKEQLFPFDAIPRVIPADQFATIEKRSCSESEGTELLFAGCLW